MILKEDKFNHLCKEYYGRLIDVTVRNDKTIHCKKCGKVLLNTQVNPNMLKKIKKENRKN